MVLHDLNLASRYSDYLLAMCDGKIDRYGEHGAQQDCDQEYLFHGCDFLRFFIVCRDE